MLFNEPKLLKRPTSSVASPNAERFSALQRAEIAETQRHRLIRQLRRGFSALQRAEIAEISAQPPPPRAAAVSVLFNEPKLLKPPLPLITVTSSRSFSALQRAEIAETCRLSMPVVRGTAFQCSSTSRNC